MEAKDTNPYVAVAAKKQRNLKKKLEKIVKFEGQLAAGKVLDDEQLALVNSKRTVEKALQEITTIKTQLEEVAKSVESGEVVAEDNQVVVASETVVSERHVHTHTVTTSEQVTTEVEIDNNGEETADVANSDDFHMKVVQYAVSTMTETDVDEVVVSSSAASAPTSQAVDVKAEQDKVIYKVLKAFHVYHKYKDVTGSNLPDEFDFFVKTLLGLTFISQFGDALVNSCRAASNFVNDDSSEVIRGLNYGDMSNLVEQLSDEIEGKASARVSAGTSLTALLRSSLSMASAPEPVAAPQEEEQEEEEVVEEEYEEEEYEEEEIELKFGVDEIPPSFQFTPAIDSFNVDNEAITGFTIPAEDDEEEEFIEEVKVTTTTTTTTTEEHIVVIDGEVVEHNGDAAKANKPAFKKNNNKRNNKKFDKEAPADGEEQGDKPAYKKKDYKKKEHNNNGEAPKKHFKKANGEEGATSENKPVKPKSFSDSVRSNLPESAAAPATSAEPQQAQPQGERKHYNRDNNRFHQNKKFEPRGQEQQGEGDDQQKPFVRREKKVFNKDAAPRPPKPASESVPAAAPVPVTVDLDDGFQQPRRHVESLAKKAKKAAEQNSDRPQQPRPFKPNHQKSENSSAPKPVAAPVTK